jgi:hypothetical protein
MAFGELGVDAGGTDLAQVSVGVAMGIEPFACGNDPGHVTAETECTMRIGNHPLSDGGVPSRGLQNAIETRHLLGHVQNRPGLGIGRDDSTSWYLVTTDVASSDGLPDQRVSTVFVTARVKLLDPRSDSCQVVTDLDCAGDAQRYVDGIELQS